MLVTERARHRASGTPRSRRVLAVGGCAIAAALLYVLYLRQSGTEPVGSDGSTLTLQAWDIAHGNPLLSGWAMSDVSFWPGDLGQYALIEALHGLSSSVVHIGGALTYTLVLVLAALLASAGLRGRTAWVAGLVTAVVLISPGLGVATRILLEEPDHFGSAVPVLLAWLLILRLPSRWYRTVLVALVLTLGVVADPLVIASGTVGVAVGCVCSGGRPPGAPRFTSGVWGRRTPLVLASLASWPLAIGVSRLVRAAGGFGTQPVRSGFAGWSAVGHHLRLAAEGLARLLGAGFGTGPEGGSSPVGFALVHVAGVLLVVIALIAVLVRPRLWADPLLGGMAAAILLLAALFVGSGYAFDPLSVREISAVAPFGAVLAGRVLAGPALAAWDRSRRGVRAVAAGLAGLVLVGYLAAIGYSALQPQAPAVHQQVADWLVAHGMDRGLALDYWVANSVTVDSGGRVIAREIEVHNGRAVRPSGWGHRDTWYRSYADYVLSEFPPGSGFWRGVTATFGPPARVYHPDGYWVLAYRSNLMPSLTG